MTDQDMQHLVATAVHDVLETMFFCEASDLCEPETDIAQLQARVAFSGAKAGTVNIRISELSARDLAASFLGESEASLVDTQVAQVVCELANMLCGSIVTRIEAQGCFDLGAPELLIYPDEQTPVTAEIQKSFAIERGILTVSLTSCRVA